MGALIHYTRDPFRPGVYEVRPSIADITALDAVRATFPELGDVPLTMQRNGRALYPDDILEEGDIVWVHTRPEAFGAAAVAGAGAAGFWSTLGSVLLQAFVYAAVSYLVSYLMRPKGKKDKAASPAYSVSIDQNAARLGGIVPVQYGRCLAMPDIASQAYAEFLAHNERVSMILCLGMGEYDIHDIYLGESRVLDFPPGNVATWIFRPQDHGRVLGNIERITGVAEDMLTIPESMGVDLAAPNDPAEITLAASVSGGTLMPNNPAEAQLWVGLVPGRQYVVTNSAGGRAVVGYVGQGPNNSAVFDGPLPAGPPVENYDVSAGLIPFDDAQEGRVMMLYSQQSLGGLRIDEIVYVRDDTTPPGMFGPFQIARIDTFPARAYLRLSGPGFTSATGEQGFSPQRWLWVVRNQFVTYSIAEYVPGTDPADPFRWRGWYASCRPHAVVDTIYVDFVMPNGVTWITDKGEYRPLSVQFLVDIQQIDDAGNPTGGLWRNSVTIGGATSTARRITYKYPSPWGPGRFRIRVARVSQRDQRASKEISNSAIASIRARVWHPPGTPAYENCTLVVMQFVASAGLNAASNRRVKIDCSRKLPALGDASLGLYSQWPTRDGFIDAYINTDYGGARPRSEMNLDKIWTLGNQWATTNGFNGIFDSETTLIDAMQAILAPVKAMPLPTGKIMSVVQDCPRPRAYAFGDDTIVKDSLSVAYIFDGENQPDCLAVVYNDATTWAENRVFYPFEGVRPETVELFGCTSAAHAMAWAKLTWQQKQYNRKRATIELEGEGYLLDPLDRFGVTIPAVGHGGAGRVIQYDPVENNIVSDTFVPASTTQVRFINDAGELSDYISAARVSDHEFHMGVPPPFPIRNAVPEGDATNFVLLQDESQYFEFSVTDLQTTANLRVGVNGQQYSAAAYAGTFVENWTPGD